MNSIVWALDVFCYALALPSTIVFLCVGIILTLKTRFVQFRALPYLGRLLSSEKKLSQSTQKTISSLQALFTSLSTTLGMGNIIGPSIAIISGGPGALFWLVAYAFLGGVTRFTEVTFALFTRRKTDGGKIVGGPTEYLKLVHPAVALWYGGVMIFLFAGWSALQANTLAGIYALEGIPTWMTGLALALMVIAVLAGGIKRVGYIASRLVPVMFLMYLSFSLIILFKNVHLLGIALKLVFEHAFTPSAAIGGFLGASVFQAIRSGVYRSIFITEAGLGTSSIPHSIADVKRPTDQGVLAMYSITFDAFLSFISGLLVLVTGIWITSGFSNTIMYEVFKMHSPTFGRLILLGSITLFVLTTVIGNSFNGSQSFASFVGYRYIRLYQIFTGIVIFLGALINVPLIWTLMDIILTFVAVPNLISLVILAYNYPEVLSIKKE